VRAGLLEPMTAFAACLEDAGAMNGSREQNQWAVHTEARCSGELGFLLCLVFRRSFQGFLRSAAVTQVAWGMQLDRKNIR
jgi:hypothetical protein